MVTRFMSKVGLTVVVRHGCLNLVIMEEKTCLFH